MFFPQESKHYILQGNTLRRQIFFFKLAVIATLALLASGVDMFEAAQHLMIENG